MNSSFTRPASRSASSSCGASPATTPANSFAKPRLVSERSAANPLAAQQSADDVDRARRAVELWAHEAQLVFLDALPPAAHEAFYREL
eukprot:2757894-Prymnesium_polylepis.1